MRSWQIFMATLGELRRDPDATLRVFLGPVLLVFAVGVLLQKCGSDSSSVWMQMFRPAPNPWTGIVLPLFYFAFQIALYSVAAVAWHRLILLNEAPGRFFPRLHLKETGAYLLAGFLQLCVMVLIVVVICALIGFALGLLRLSGQQIGAITGFVGALLGNWLFLRFASNLPNTALREGRPILFGLRATSSEKMTLFLVNLLSLVYAAVVGWIGGFIQRHVPILALGSAFSDFALLAFNVALLTVLYQRYVLKADVDIQATNAWDAPASYTDRQLE